MLCITHLPQIAARATTHFHIDKRVRGTRTVTTVARLEDEERVAEIGRMIGGAQVTESARTTARDMLASGRRVVSQGAKSTTQRRAKAKGESESR